MKRLGLSMLSILVLLYGCASINPGAKKELLVVKEAIQAELPDENKSGNDFQSPNETALEKELWWLRRALKNIDKGREVRLESLPKRYLGKKEEEIIRRFGPPHDKIENKRVEWQNGTSEDVTLQRRTETKLLTYFPVQKQNSPLKSFFLPTKKSKPTALHFVIMEEKVVKIILDIPKGRVVWEAPVIVKYVPLATIPIKGF